VGPIADFVVAAFAGATALLDNLGWERMLVIPIFLGALLLAILGIRRIEASAERRPQTFTSRMVTLGTKALLAIVIFLAVYAMSVSLSGPGLPMVMMLGLLMATVVTTVREVTKRRGRMAGMRG
jgi:hypothetical protein